jgi:hypothetical protein
MFEPNIGHAASAALQTFEAWAAVWWEQNILRLYQWHAAMRSVNHVIVRSTLLQ